MSNSPSNPRIPWLKDSVNGAAYKRGDVIDGRFEVFGILGKGGFGIVYLVHARELGGALALKTFRDEYLDDALTKDRFRKEAGLWVDLERHPHVVRAYLVDEVAGRLFICLEFIPPDLQGLNSLEGHLRQRPPDLAQSLRWAIQFCLGIEYAYSRGIRCHRDIKPANIMIDRDKAVKITDFGLAGVLGTAQAMSGVRVNVHEGLVGLSGQTMKGTGFGTPTHMPPEQFIDAVSCDERSDIYSFGIVLYQMASEGRLPFLAELPRDGSDMESARFWREMHRLHLTSPAPRLGSPLSAIIQRCLEKQPDKRYQSFSTLRADIEPLLTRLTGEIIRVPDREQLDALEWHLKAYSFGKLERYEEENRCYDEALALAPREAVGWRNKARALHRLGRYKEALSCCDKSLEIDSLNADAWSLKGTNLDELGHPEEAILCLERALNLNPNDVATWNNIGNSLCRLSRYEEAIRCFGKYLQLDPRDAAVWCNYGISLSCLDRHEEALRCYDKALELEHQSAGTWCSKGLSLGSLGRDEEAIHCYDKALGLVAGDPVAWYNKGLSLYRLGRCDEALPCYARAIELNPSNADAWNEKGACLGALGRYEEGIPCFNRAIELDPHHAAACFIRGMALEGLGRKRDAMQSYRQCIEVASARCEELVEDARQRVRKLEGS